MAYRIEIAHELIAKARHLYEETDMPVREIAKMLGMSRWTLHSRVTTWQWTPRLGRKRGLPAATEAELAALPAAGTAAPPLEPPLPFAERLRRVIDAQMQVAERTLKVLGPASSAEAERTSRILALVSRTVQDITATSQGQTNAHEADADAVPVDIDEFREELARRIHAFVDTRQDGPSGSGDAIAAADDGGRTEVLPR